MVDLVIDPDAGVTAKLGTFNAARAIGRLDMLRRAGVVKDRTDGRHRRLGRATHEP